MRRTLDFYREHQAELTAIVTRHEIQVFFGESRPVCSFPIREYWLDIGDHKDYEKAQDQMKEVRRTI